MAKLIQGIFSRFADAVRKQFPIRMQTSARSHGKLSRNPK